MLPVTKGLDPLEIRRMWMVVVMVVCTIGYGYPQYTIESPAPHTDGQRPGFSTPLYDSTQFRLLLDVGSRVCHMPIPPSGLVPVGVWVRRRCVAGAHAPIGPLSAYTLGVLTITPRWDTTLTRCLTPSCPHVTRATWIEARGSGSRR
jgi:hypothetical protein